MSKVEYIIWKCESMEQIKEEHPELISQEDENQTKKNISKYLFKIANKINDIRPDFFGSFWENVVADLNI